MALYRLLAGIHIQKEPVTDDKGNPIKDENGKVQLEEVRYDANDNNVVESEKDLVKVLGRDKFQLMDSGKRRSKKKGTVEEPVESSLKPANDGLDELTVAELRDLADAEEVELDGAHLKADILAKIRENRGE